MRITRITTDLLRLPPARSLALPLAEERKSLVPPPPEGLFVLLVHLETDEGLSGLGFATSFAAGRALQAVVEDDLAPRLIGHNPLWHERIGDRIRHELPALGRGGLFTKAFAAIDIALWDLKGKAAGLPLYKLLGACRDSAVAYGADTAWPWLSADNVLETARSLIANDIRGLSVSIGGQDAQADAQRLQRIRDAVGEQLWFGVNGQQAYDVGTALAMGRFLEEELDADWYENPIIASDHDGYVRLASKLEVPVAAGSLFDSAAEFRQLLTANAVGMVRPNVQRLGGITTWLKVVGMAEAFHRPIVPHGLTEVSLHLACGRAGVQAIEHVTWLEPLWKNPPELVDGLLVPPPGPGLGLELNPEAVTKFGA